MKNAIVRLMITACLPLAACGERSAQAWRGPGTVQMAERLAQIAAETDPRNIIYGGSSARLEAMRDMPPPPDRPSQLQLKAALTRELLHAGRTQEAIAGFEELLAELRSHRGQVPRNFVSAILESLAIAHLKLWEHEYCVANSNSLQCLVPIIPEGEGSSGETVRPAVRIYESLLESDPDDLNTRWFLNLAYMMLGEYPEGVPEQWVVPPEAFRSEHEVKRFPDIAAELGLNVSGHAGGAIMDDFDGDGHLDVVVSSWHLSDQLRFFRSNGDGTFSERTIEAGLEGIVGGLNLVQADYNNDGHLDVFVLRGAWLPYGMPNSLLRNNGDGTFEDVTREAGLAAEYSTQTASWGDYDNDGWVDLYIGNESTEGRLNPNQLFHNNRDGTFSDVADEAGVGIAGFVKAVVWGDMDNDGRLDLYVSRLNQPNVLFRNDGPDARGRWTFSNVTASAGVAEPMASFPTWFWDYDNDGWLDIFVSGFRGSPGSMTAEYLGLPHKAEPPRLYRNAGDGTFEDVTSSARLDKIMLTMGSNFGDLDNDGYEDMYVGTGDSRYEMMIPNRMFLNQNGELFKEVTTAGGFGLLQKGHGVAFGDLDHDGDQDIYATLGGAQEGDVGLNVLFENPGHGNRWITLRVEGVRSNRAAIGARIKVLLQTESGPRAIHRTVSSGGSFGANSLQQEIGLGRASAIEAIEITWPATGRTDSYIDVEMNRVYTVREGDQSLTPIITEPLRLASDR